MNPLVECESFRHGLSKKTHEIHEFNPPKNSVYPADLDSSWSITNKDINLYRFKTLPIQIGYFENNKMCKITIDLSKE
jgi:hypothetical protein